MKAKSIIRYGMYRDRFICCVGHNIHPFNTPLRRTTNGASTVNPISTNKNRRFRFVYACIRQ